MNWKKQAQIADHNTDHKANRPAVQFFHGRINHVAKVTSKLDFSHYLIRISRVQTRHPDKTEQQEPLVKFTDNKPVRHSREDGNPELIDSSRNWIPDYYLGNDEVEVLQEARRRSISRKIG